MHKALGKDRNFFGLENETSAFDTSAAVIVPAPFGLSSSVGSDVKDGPRAILAASRHVECFDEETKREISKERGIATLAPLNLAKKKDEAALQEIHELVAELQGLRKFVVTLGGDHTISSATIAAHAKKFTDLSVLQFDAHSELRHKFQGNKYSHASVMARVCEFIEPTRLVQVGIRSQSRDEAEYIRDRGVHAFYAHEIRSGAHSRFLRTWDDAVVEKLTETVYVSFDLSVFDPSIMPAVRNPEPNGLFWHEVVQCLKKVSQKRKIVGFDIVELSPLDGLLYPNITAAKLVSKILNYAL